MARRKQSGNARSQGRQNAFSGTKLAFLESYKDQFLNTTDRGAFYTMVTKTYLQKFGYCLTDDDNPTVDDETVDATSESDPAHQSPEEREEDNNQRNKTYRELREKLGCWFRYRYTSKNTNQTYINHIIERIMSSSVTRPRRKSAMNVYMDTNKTLLNQEFSKRWDAVKGTMRARDRIRSWTEFVKDRWEKEPPAVRDSVTKQAEEENATRFNEWKQKAAFAGTAEDLDKAWRMSEGILPTFADAMAEWLGANVIILAVAPLGSADGEIVIRSAQSDTSRGMTKKLVSEFDPEGWKKAQQTMLAHGNAYFTPEECRRRIIKNETDNEDAYMDDDENSTNSTSASSVSLLSLSQEVALPNTLNSAGDPTTSTLITQQQQQQQQQDAAIIIPSSAPSISQRETHATLLPFEAARQSALPASGMAANLPQLDGLYSFLDTDRNVFTSFPSSNAAMSNASWSGGGVANLPQPSDDTLDSFSLSLPFQQPVVSCATPITATTLLDDLGPSTMTATTTASVPTTQPIPLPHVPITPSLAISTSTPSLVSPYLAFDIPKLSSSFVPPPPAIPSAVQSSTMPSSIINSPTFPSSVSPSSEIPPSESLSSAVLPLGSSSLEIPPSESSSSEIVTSQPSSSETQSSENPFSKTPSLASEMPSSESPPSNCATTAPTVITSMAENSEKPSFINTTTINSPGLHGKENIAPAEVTETAGSGEKAKKRKAVNSTKPKRKRPKVTQDNSTMADTHVAQEIGAPGDTVAAEIAPTRSGRKSNLPSHLKDGGYAPPKRTLRSNARGTGN